MIDQNEIAPGALALIAIFFGAVAMIAWAVVLLIA
jgi:hypothetical protein